MKLTFFQIVFLKLQEPIDVKNNIKRMATEVNKIKNEDKFKFQGQYARSQRWFNLDFDCIEEKFSTCENDFYRKIYQRHDETQDKNTFKMFKVPILNTKCVDEINFSSKA